MKTLVVTIIALFLVANANVVYPKDKHKHSKSQIQSSKVTYTFSGGRFGDNLLAYIHAKWIAYRYHIPLLYKPFDCSDQLVLHNLEELYNERKASQFRNQIHLGER